MFPSLLFLSLNDFDSHNFIFTVVMVSGSLKSSQGQEDRVQTKRESRGQDPLQIYLETKSTVCDASLKVCFLYFLLVKYFHTNTFNS